jgi:hypothetical protein
MDEMFDSLPWNDPARISCEFAFKCPKTLQRLRLTGDPNVRHCPECDRDVHLALTESDFRRHVEERHCVAVRVLRPEGDNQADLAYIVGSVGPPYAWHLRKV